LDRKWAQQGLTTIHNSVRNAISQRFDWAVFGHSAISQPQTCPRHPGEVFFHLVKAMSFKQMKRQEAQSRMAALRKARRNPAAAAALQRRASLVGDGAKWRITNFNEVARAMARWK
jgi:hypothetical protein